jgi:hypothetical protein
LGFRVWGIGFRGEGLLGVGELVEVGGGRVVKGIVALPFLFLLLAIAQDQPARGSGLGFSLTNQDNPIYAVIQV